MGNVKVATLKVSKIGFNYTRSLPNYSSQRFLFIRPFGTLFSSWFFPTNSIISDLDDAAAKEDKEKSESLAETKEKSAIQILGDKVKEIVEENGVQRKDFLI